MTNEKIHSTRKHDVTKPTKPTNTHPRDSPINAFHSLSHLLHPLLSPAHRLNEGCNMSERLCVGALEQFGLGEGGEEARVCEEGEGG